MTELIGYARVSSLSQNLDDQIDDLKKTGCTKIFSDKVSGTSKEREGWDELIRYMRPGDMLVITELSRMSRSLSHLLEIVDQLKAKQVQFKSLRENIDASTATGRADAKARGKSGGRPRTDPDKLEQARILYLNSDKSAPEVCGLFGFSRRTLFSYMKQVQTTLKRVEQRQ